MATEIAKAYVQLVTSAEGIKGQIAGALGDEIDEATGSAESKWGSAASKIGKAAATSIAAGVTAVTAFGKTAVTTGMDFDAAMSQVAATMGTTVGEIGELRDFAQEMGATTQFSATQAAEALNYMALAGYDAGTSLDMLPTVLDLAAAGGIGLASASDMVTDAQSALGLTLDETVKMVDEMAKASSKSNTSVAQLGEAYLTVGGTAKNLSGGTLEAATALGILADNGIKGSEGGTALRNIILSLAAPTDKAAKLINELGVNVFDSEGNMRELNDVFGDFNAALGTMSQQDQIGYINGIFNKVDLKSVNALLANTKTGFVGIGDALSGVTYDAEAAAVAFSTATGEVYDASEMTTEFLSSTVEWWVSTGDGIDDVTQKLQTCFGMQEEEAAEIAALASASITQQQGMQQAVLGSVDSWGKYSDSAWMSNRSVEEAVNSVTSEIIYNLFEIGSNAQETAEYLQMEYGIEYEDALAAVNAVSESVTDQSSRWTELKGEIDNSTGAAQEMANTQMDNLAGDVTTLQSAYEGLQIAISDSLTPSLRDFVQFASESIGELTRAFKEEGLDGFMSALGDVISDGLALVIETLPKAVEAGTELLLALVKGIVDNLPAIADAAGECIITLANGLGDALPELIPSVVAVVMEIASSIVDNAPAMLDGALALIVGLGEGLIRSIPEIVQRIPDLIAGIVSAVIEFAPLMIEGAIELALGLATGLIGAIPDIVVAIPEIIGALILKIKDGIPDFIESGVDMIKGIGQGFVDGVTYIIDRIKDIGDRIVQGFKDFFGIHSPSTVMAEIGGFLIEGIIQGLSDSFHGIVDFLSGAWTGVVEFFEGSWEAIVSSASGLAEDIGTAFSSARELAVGAWDNISTSFSAVWQSVQGAFENVESWFSDRFSAARDLAVSAWGTASSAFATARDNALSAFSEVHMWFSEKFTQARELAVAAWSNAQTRFQLALKAVQGVFVNIPTWFGDTFAKARDSAVNAFSNAKQKFTSVWNNIKSAFNVKEALSWGKDLIANFISGIASMLTSLKTAITNVAKTIKSIIGFSQPDTGPLADFDTYAPDMMELFAEGIDSNADLIQDAVSTAFDVDMEGRTREWVDVQEDMVTAALEKTRINWEKYAGEYWYDSFGAAGLSGDITYNLTENKDSTSISDLQDYLQSEYSLDVLDSIEAVKAASWALYEPTEEQAHVAQALSDSAVEWAKYADTQWFDFGGVDALVDDVLYNIKDLSAGAQETAEYLQMEYGLDADDALAAVESVNEALHQGTEAYQEQLEVSSVLADSGVDWSKYASEYWYTAHGQTNALVDDMLYNLQEIGSTAEETADYFHWDYNLDYDDAYVAINAVTGYLQTQSGVVSSVQSSVQAAGDEWTGFAEGCTVAMESTSAGLLGIDAQILSSTANTDLLGDSVLDMSSTWSVFSEESTAAIDGSQSLMAGFSAALTDLGTQASGLQDALQLECNIETNADDVILDMQSVALSVDDVTNSTAPLSSEFSAMSSIAALAGECTSLAMQDAETSVSGLTDTLDTSTVAASELADSLSVEASIDTGDAVLALGEIASAGDVVEESLDSLAGACEDVPVEFEADMTAAAATLGIPRDEAINLVDDYVQVGGDMSDGIGEGFIGKVSSVIEKVKEFGRTIIQGIKDFFGISSPSTVMAEIGGFLADGLFKGISDTWQSIIDFFAGAWQAIVDGASTVSEGLTTAFTAAKESITVIWSTISETFTGAWTAIQSVFDGVDAWFSETFTSAKDSATQAWDGIQDAFSTAWTGIQNAFTGAAEWFGTTFEAGKTAAADAWSDVQESFTTVWASIQSVFTDVGSWFQERFAEARDLAANSFEGLKDKIEVIRSGIEKAYETLPTWFSDTFAQARDLASKAWENATEKFESAKTKIQNVFESVPEWFEERFSKARDKAIKVWDNIKSKFTTVWNNIKSAFNISDAFSWGADLLKNFISGIKSKIADLKTALSGLGEAVKGRIGFSEPDEGPLSDFHTYAPDMMRLFSKGIVDSKGLVQSALDDTLTLKIPQLDVASLNILPMYGEFDTAGAQAQSTGDTYNFYSPKALDPVSAMREMKKQSQRLAMAC